MSGTYSRVVEASVTGGVSNCIELPVPPRGILDRIVVKQTDGASEDFDFIVYNRKGACPTGNDLHVNAGTVTSIGTNGGATQLTIVIDQVYPYGHVLAVGDEIYVKGTDVAAYNIVHTVTSIDNAGGTLITTSGVAYSSAGTGGYWQDNTPQVFPRHDPTMHLVSASTTGTAGNASANFDMNRTYENDDNQDFTKRTQAQALWLDLVPGGTGAKTFEVAVTVNVEFMF